MDKKRPSDMQILHVLYHRMNATPEQTVTEKHKQNINLLSSNNYRSDEALDVSNANNKDWTNFSRLIIILPIYEFK